MEVIESRFVLEAAQNAHTADWAMTDRTGLINDAA